MILDAILDVYPRINFVTKEGFKLFRKIMCNVMYHKSFGLVSNIFWWIMQVYSLYTWQYICFLIAVNIQYTVCSFQFLVPAKFLMKVFCFCFWSILNFPPGVILNSASDATSVSFVIFAILADIVGVEFLLNLIFIIGSLKKNPVKFV